MQDFLYARHLIISFVWFTSRAAFPPLPSPPVKPAAAISWWRPQARWRQSSRVSFYRSCFDDAWRFVSCICGTPPPSWNHRRRNCWRLLGFGPTKVVVWPGTIQSRIYCTEYQLHCVIVLRSGFGAGEKIRDPNPDGMWSLLFRKNVDLSCQYSYIYIYII